MQKLTILFEGMIEQDGETKQVAEHITVTVENCKGIGDALQAYVSSTGIDHIKVPKVVEMSYVRSL